VVSSKYLFNGAATIKCDVCGKLLSVEFSGVCPDSIDEAIQTAGELEDWEIVIDEMENECVEIKCDECHGTASLEPDFLDELEYEQEPLEWEDMDE